MSDYMPPRAEGLEGVPLDLDGVVIGKIPVRGVGLRVGMQGLGRLLLMSPAKARRFAKDWTRPEVVAAGMDWISRALIEAADEIEATPLSEQIRMAEQAWATISARGPSQ